VRRTLDRWATPRRVLALFVLDALLLGGVNLVDFPLSVPSMRRLTGGTYLDMCAFCSGTRVSSALAAFGNAGRMQQLAFTATIDLAIPLVSAAFGALAARLFGCARLAWVPILAGALDYAENAAIVALVVRYPSLLGLAGLMGILSGLKAIAYGASIAIVVVGAVRWRWRAHVFPHPA
jgi:hypothetical protein